MSTIFEIATNVSTPLMVAGFLSAAFFLILRRIVGKDIFPRLTRALSVELLRLIVDRLFILSLIALVLGFLGFALTLVYSNPQPEEQNVKVLKTTVSQTSDVANANFASRDISVSVPEFSTSKYGHYDVWPALDYRLKNVGGEVGLVTAVTLEVIEAVPDLSPDLYFQLLQTADKNLALRIVNLGWGAARGVDLEYLSGSIRDVLRNEEASLRWEGTIEDYVVLQIPKTLIKAASERQFLLDEIGGRVQYQDVHGNRYDTEVKYNSWTADRILRVKPDGFYIIMSLSLSLEAGEFHRPLLPSAVYDVLLEPKETPSRMEVPVSQPLNPGEPDRFQILVGSTQATESARLV